MAYGATHSETIPTVGVTLGPAYATAVNAVLTEMRATLNAKVTPAGIDVNADLSMRSGATRYGLTNAHRLALYQQPALLNAVTYPAALYSDVSGNLYYNNASGNQVQVTAGAALNAAATGGITGTGYGSAGVALNWDSATGDYRFYSAAATFADIQISALQLSDGSSNFIRMAAPAGMSVDYTMTLPGAVPAATSLLYMTSAGTLTTTGVAKTRQVDLTQFHQTSGTNLAVSTSGSVATGGIGFGTPVIGNRASVIVPMRVGETLQSVQIVMNENLSGGNARVVFRLYKGGVLIVAQNSSGSGVQTVTLTDPAPAILVASTTDSDAYAIDIEVDGNTGIADVMNAYVTYLPSA